MSTNGSTHYTPTEKAILEILSDGKPHAKHDIAKHVDPEMGQCNVANHILQLRKKLEPLNEDIVCVYRLKKYFYRQIRVLHSPYDGKH